MGLKKIGEERGYSIYENPDKEMVEAIKSISTKDLVCTEIAPFWGKELTLSEVTDMGKYIMVNNDGDMVSISKEDYEEGIKESLLQRINENFDAATLVNNYMLPFFNGGYTLIRVEDLLEGRSEKDKKKLKNMGTYSRWHSFRTLECRSYRYKQDYYGGTTSFDYTLQYNVRGDSCTIYLDSDGNLRNRDYHVNFEMELNREYMPVEDVIKKYITQFKDLDVTEFDYHNEKWFTDEYVIYFAEKDGTTMLFKRIPHQNKNSYYISGESYNKINKPKSAKKVSKQHFIDFVESKLVALGELEDPILGTKYTYTQKQKINE